MPILEVWSLALCPALRMLRDVSIATKTGDDGTTGLMYNRRVPKCHPRVEAYGAVDELNSALGLARAHNADPFIAGQLNRIQPQLITLMGELATASEDIPAYIRDGFTLVTSALTEGLHAAVREVESHDITFSGWAVPGANPAAAALDLARAICRRAERRVCALHEQGQLGNREIIAYLNRLADLLWLLARWAEAPPNPKPTRC